MLFRCKNCPRDKSFIKKDWTQTILSLPGAAISRGMPGITEVRDAIEIIVPSTVFLVFPKI
ncbi:hypothetical protein J6590_075671 [Homalodisca vitripennis]|nr:hypothetical protein J6590_075671 [Homalodisca vitripennis]